MQFIKNSIIKNGVRESGFKNTGNQVHKKFTLLEYFKIKTKEVFHAYSLYHQLGHHTRE